MIAVQRLTEVEFASMRAEWDDLLGRAQNPGPMLTWEWAHVWWETFAEQGVRRELRVLAARDAGGRLAGLAPLIARPVRAVGLDVRRLEFIGTGEDEADETCSEFLDVLAAPEEADAVADAMAQHLRGARDWDELVLRDVRADRPSVVSRLVARLGMHAAEFNRARCPFIRLPASWDAYLGGLSPNSRRLVRAKRRHAVDRGAGEFLWVEDGGDVRARFADFRSLHQGRWQLASRPGCFASEAFATFLESVTVRLSDAGGVCLAVLKLRGEVAAVYHLLRQGRCLYYYNSGMDAARFGEFSPGSVCQAYIIEAAIARGFSEYHFFKGGPGSYKYHWTDEAVPVVSLRVRRPGLRAVWGAVADGAGRAARALRARLYWGVVAARREEASPA